MPLVEVSRNRRVSDVAFERLIDGLPALVAEALTCDNPDGRLEPKDVEVWNRPRDERWDRGGQDIQIVVEANDYPERRVDLDERQEKLRAFVKSSLPSGIHGWVWVRIATGSFGQF